MAETVTPANQATTAAYVDVAGSLMDTLNYLTVSYTIKERNTNAVKWKVLASNDADFTVSVEAQAEAVVAKNATASYNTAAAVWRYYKVQVKDSVDETHGSVAVVGVMKG